MLVCLGYLVEATEALCLLVESVGLTVALLILRHLAWLELLGIFNGLALQSEGR